MGEADPAGERANRRIAHAMVTVRRGVIAVTEKRIHGGWAAFLCRKRYIDDRLADAVAKGIDAVVILGAGHDTRVSPAGTDRYTGLRGRSAQQYRTEGSGAAARVWTSSTPCDAVAHGFRDR